MNSTSIPLLDWSDPRISDLLGKKTPPAEKESIPKKNGATKTTKPIVTKVGDWQTAAEIKPRELSWLWPGKIPLGLLCMFAGDPSLGKSLMTIETMARGSRGDDFLDGEKNELGPFDTILLSGEDDRSTIIIPRLMATGADLTRIHLLSMVRIWSDGEPTDEERAFTLESDLSVIREKLQTNSAIRLVVIDPLSNYLGSKDMNREQEVRSVLMPIIALAQEFSVAVVIVAHHGKAMGRTAQQKVLGAVGCVGAGRMGWSFVKSGDDDQITQMLLMKRNLGNFPGMNFTTETTEIALNDKPSKQARIKYLSPSTVSVENVIAQAEDLAARIEKPAVALIRSMMPPDSDHVTEVWSDPIEKKALEQGISKTTLYRARKQIRIKTERVSNQWVWRWLSEDEKDA